MTGGAVEPGAFGFQTDVEVTIHSQSFHHIILPLSLDFD